MLPIAILQNDESVPPGLLGSSFEARRVPVNLIEVYRGDSLPDLGDVSGVVILGGHMGAYEEQAHPFLVEEKELVRQAVGRKVPLLGICLGCQIMAEALGGKAYRVEPQEAGLIEMHLTEIGQQDPVLGSLSGPMVSWHHDSWDVPSTGQLLARSDTYPQALRVGTAVGVQFHPEVTTEILDGWIRRDGDSLRGIGIDPLGFKALVESGMGALRDRADRLFGSWLAEVGDWSP